MSESPKTPEEMRAANPHWGRAFDTDDGRYVGWALKEQPDAVFPRVTAWDDFVVAIWWLFVIASPFLLILLLVLLLL